mgnify:CR=1 FL=1|tara:strand:+ start:135 stop:704 length:570 start_codon:yes stop_codon:yes gene_type:complete
MSIILKSGNISHEDCVIKSERKECRVMSDVYTDADYALLWNPEEQRTEWKRINVLYMGCDDHSQIIVDIHSGEYAEDYEIYLFLQEEQEKARQFAEDEKMYKSWLTKIEKGAICRAVKGRKVPKGTEGIIFYIRDNRIGFKGDDDVAHWINADQIEVMYKAWDFEPAYSWASEWKMVSARRYDKVKESA